MPDIQYNEFHDDATRKRLSDIANTRTTPRAVIDSIIHKELADTIQNITRIVRGETNEVYDISTTSGREIILRIGHWDKMAFQREAWAINQAGAVGVSVPEIVATGEIFGENQHVYYCMQEKLQGTLLSDLLHSKTMSAEKTRYLIEAAGEALGKIHTIRTTGWGYLVEQDRGEYATLKDRYTKVEREADNIAAAVRKTDADIKISLLLDNLKTGLRAFEGNQRLIHGDFGPKHIFIDDNDAVAGVIDWEQTESSDPALEFARWEFWFEKFAPTEWLKAGHERSASLGDNFDERLRIAKLESAVWTLLYFTYNSISRENSTRAIRVISEAIK